MVLPEPEINFSFFLDSLLLLINVVNEDLMWEWAIALGIKNYELRTVIKMTKQFVSFFIM